MTERIQQPWGYETTLERNDYYVLKKLVFAPTMRLDRQYYVQKHKTIFVLSGSGKVSIADDTRGAEPGNVFVIRPGIVHRLSAGAEGLVILETSTAGVDEAVRLEDQHGN